MNKPQIKFGEEHTCTCKNPSINTETSEFIGCDFKNRKKEGFKGYIWFKNTCNKCKGTVLTGQSYADYRVVGEGLLLSAIQSLANTFSYQTFNLLSNQFYKGKHWQGQFIKK